MSTCRLCGFNKLSVKHHIAGVVLERCASCGYVQVREKPTQEELLDCYSPTYFDHGKYADTFALRKENERRISLIRNQRVSKGAKVLDAGCATGDFLSFARLDYDMWGLDVSEFAIGRAQKKNPEIASQIRSGFVEDQSYPDGFFDVIVLWDVLEHLWDPVEVCRRLLRTLRPGGCLCISTPNVGSFVARVMGKYWAFMTVPEHLGFCNRKTMRYLLQERLHLELVEWKTKGKWANLGFVLYKLKRIFPRLVPQALVDLFRTRILRWIAIYVPSADIQYAVARKPLEEETS